MHLSGLWAAMQGGRSPPPPHPDDHYTRPRHSRRRTNGSSGVHRTDNQHRSNSSTTLLCGVFKMPPLFNLIRIGVFGMSFSSCLPMVVVYLSPLFCMSLLNSRCVALDHHRPRDCYSLPRDSDN